MPEELPVTSTTSRCRDACALLSLELIAGHSRGLSPVAGRQAVRGDGPWPASKADGLGHVQPRSQCPNDMKLLCAGILHRSATRTLLPPKCGRLRALAGTTIRPIGLRSSRSLPLGPVLGEASDFSAPQPPGSRSTDRANCPTTKRHGTNSK